MIKDYIKKWKFLKAVDFESKDARIFINRKVKCSAAISSRIVIHKGTFRFGYHFPKGPMRATYANSVITLDDGASLEVYGDVWIAPGSYIHVCKGAKLVFRGGNLFAHNFNLIVGFHVEFGEHCSVGWNCNLIDYDGRNFFHPEGGKIERKPRKLIMKKCSGLQMHVTIPQGIVVGENSIVGSNTVLRSDVPDNSLVYQCSELTIKNNITTGLQHICDDS